MNNKKTKKETAQKEVLSPKEEIKVSEPIVDMTANDVVKKQNKRRRHAKKVKEVQKQEISNTPYSEETVIPENVELVEFKNKNWFSRTFEKFILWFNA